MFPCSKALSCVLRYSKQNFIDIQLGTYFEKARS
ncbi:hypothetical protein ME3_00743 [Bartonella melophagi K-2C]|uniref:Uncharacterized protein n=1 Tax=Bartonella melophagi K-2C TaxID=1094557 RepID=J0QW11_9HYPH|nr:hypothetical protein ME3_00743 [Bartonella melophagi K-2C]